MFDDRYYNKIIKKYKYNPMDFKPMNFYFNNIDVVRKKHTKVNIFI